MQLIDTLAMSLEQQHRLKSLKQNLIDQFMQKIKPKQQQQNVYLTTRTEKNWNNLGKKYFVFPWTPLVTIWWAQKGHYRNVH